MKKILGIGALGLGLAVGGVLLLSALYGVSKYNSLVGEDEKVTAAWAQVENQMQRRLDLIPNLVETVKGYAGHESGLYIGLANARQNYYAQANISGKVDALNNLSMLLNSVRNSVVEKYPAIKADRHFIRLMDELTGTENRLSVERKRFNDAVASYNGHVRKFPGALIAKLTGFEPIKPFQAVAAAHTAPKVKF